MLRPRIIDTPETTVATLLPKTIVGLRVHILIITKTLLYIKQYVIYFLIMNS